MGVLCIVIFAAMIVVAACTLTGQSGIAIRHGDEKAEEHYRKENKDGNKGKRI